jgi:hypothetical protein
MSSLLWYAQRAVPWPVTLGATGMVALGLAAAVLWPDRVGFLVALLVAPLAIASSFVLDEPSAPAVEVAPRSASWRTGARALALLAPAAVWLSGVVLVVQRQAIGSRGGWLLIGAASMTLAMGAAALLAASGRPMPGSYVSTGAALAFLVPYMRLPLPDRAWPYPLAGFPREAVLIWLVVLTLGAAALAAALRKRIHG